MAPQTYIRQRNNEYYRLVEYQPALQQDEPEYDPAAHQHAYAAYSAATSDYQAKLAKVEEEKKKLYSIYEDRNAYINNQYKDPARLDAKRQKKADEDKADEGKADVRAKCESDDAPKRCPVVHHFRVQHTHRVHSQYSYGRYW